jgi:hypothetical protein
MIHENWIFLGAFLNMVGSMLYVRDVLRGKARPNRVTWFILAFAPILAFSAMISQGVTFRQSLMTLVVGVSPLLVVLSTFFTKHPRWEIDRFDMVCGGLSVVGLLLWLMLREGNIAIAFGIAADGLAFLPTLRKAYFHPETESPWLFLLGLVNGAIALLIIKTWDFTHAAFPVYIFVADLLAVIFIWLRFGRFFTRRTNSQDVTS